MRPHFVRDYNRLVRHLVASEPDYDRAMALAVGGHYTEIGQVERRVLDSLGLQDAHYVIDVGAGSGRLATALSDLRNLKYLGTDVAPELLEYARKRCGREDWAFRRVDKIEIPEADAVADFVVFFSVFTHLREHESFHYLQEAKRVLKHGGTIVVSYLDRDIAHHASQTGSWWTQVKLRTLGRSVLNHVLSKSALESWSKRLDLSIDYVDAVELGQSVCAYRHAGIR